MRKLAIFLILLAASIGYTASEIQIGYKSGNTLYGIVRKHSDSTVWNDSNSAWETWSDSYVPDYNLAMADGDGDFYKADFPSGIGAGLYPINIYSRQGSDPNNDDDILVGTGDIVWDGSAEVTDYTSYTDRQTIIGDSNQLQTEWKDGGRLDLIVDGILADSNELETDWTNAGRLDAIIDLILGDSNELQTDWADGGRLDLLLDAALADTNDIQEDWAALLVNIADIETDTNDVQEDWAATLVNVADIETIVDDIQTTSGAGGF